ncbi:Structural maintenance of chromosomes protein 3, partial [Spiromyces aspiralis]
RLESAQNQQQSDSAELDKDAKSVDWYLSQRNLLTQKKEECVRNICDLGVLPEEAFQKYTGKSPQKASYWRPRPALHLLKRLHKVNSKLKKYSHVNKKAFEQYTNFTQQRDDLLARERELEESAEAIHSLIDALDQQKDETIERTFKQVAKYFSEVFGKLVPSGWGKLVMQRQIDRGNEDELYDNDENNDSVENYIGVAIK